MVGTCCILHTNVPSANTTLNSGRIRLHVLGKNDRLSSDLITRIKRGVISQLYFGFLISAFTINRIRTNYQRILQNHDVTWCYCHLKEEYLQFHSDLKCIRCAHHVWHGRFPGDTPIPAKPSQACFVWRSRLRFWCALAILVVSLEVVGRKHETANIPVSNGSNIVYFCSLFVKIWFCKILR